jgi:hypothetical protein
MSINLGTAVSLSHRIEKSGLPCRRFRLATGAIPEGCRTGACNPSQSFTVPSAGKFLPQASPNFTCFSSWVARKILWLNEISPATLSGQLVQRVLILASAGISWHASERKRKLSEVLV